MISERKLKKWRKEALRRKNYIDTNEPVRTLQYFAERILELTQELLDQRLIEQAKKEKK